ncbi:MAG: hypothetical protein GX639_21825 [Fibrobacter sp.]|nr:hypothetical protein [Fibrobacter sp.]
MKLNSKLFLSFTLNFLFLILIVLFVQYKGGIKYVVNKLTNKDNSITAWDKKVSDYLPPVDGSVLFIGDSHLALHPWNEYANFKYANRAVSGYKISDINLDVIKGKPKCVVLSIGTNDIQHGSKVDLVIRNLHSLLNKIKNKWPEAFFIYVTPPDPNVELYEKLIRPKHPKITRPDEIKYKALSLCAKNNGFIVLKANTAFIDGLHIDPNSAKKIATDVQTLLNNLTIQGINRPDSLNEHGKIISEIKNPL